MRILELGKFYPPHRGGIETLLKIWAEGFARRGAEVDCVVANTAPKTIREEINGVRVLRLASFGSVFSTSLCPAYTSAAHRFRPDLIHAHFPNPLSDLALLRAPQGVPVLLSYHSDIIRQASALGVYRPILQRVLRRANAIVVASPPQLRHSPWLQGVVEKCHVIPFGIDLDRLSNRAAEGLPRRRFTVLTVGRLVGYKGHAFLINAMRPLDADLWIVGSGPLDGELKALASRLGVADRVVFFGAVDDAKLPGLLGNCDVFALPSVTPNEAFGLVQLEAMGCGKPVVSCELPSGVPWVNQHEITGLVVPPKNALALTEALARLQRNPDLAHQLGQAGLRRVRAEFSADQMLDRYWNLIQKLTLFTKTPAPKILG